MPKQPTTEKTSALDGQNDAAESTEDTTAGASYLVPGLERGLRILAEFSARKPILGAPELSKRIGIPRTTTFRLLQTLESLGFLERVNDDRNFRLGVAVLRLGFEYLSSLELTDFAAPILERLRDATGLNAHLLIRDQRDVVFVARPEPRRHVQFGEGACRHAFSCACNHARTRADERPGVAATARALSGETS